MVVPNPYKVKPRNPLWDFVTPINTGLFVGAVLAAFPHVLGEHANVLIVDALLKSEVFPRQLCVAVLGFMAGYVLARAVNYLRWKLVKLLMTYLGWITSPKSLRTKAWALLLKGLSGPGPQSTYTFQPYMPNLPLPSLNATLDRWLEVSKTLVSEAEFESVKEHVEHFRKNEGLHLQSYLMEKARTSDSWIYDYWINAVYLCNRQPLAVNSNYYGQYALPEYKTKDPVARAAMVTRVIAEFFDLLEKNKLPPVVLQDIIPLCMSGYRYMFNTVRVPKEYKDEIVRYPGHNHIVVLRKGHFFKLDLRYEDNSLLTADELKILLTEIRTIADGIEEGRPVAALTAQRRDLWAKQRVQLMEKNKDVLHDIETAAFVLSLCDQVPKTFDESAWLSLTGGSNQVWQDKCFTFTIYDNGVSAGATVDHTVLDAMVMGSITEYIMLFEEYENGDIKRDPSVKPRPLKSPQRLQWDVEDMETEISTAAKDLSLLANDVEVTICSAKYGKRFMKKCRLSPDGYIQMIIQLAYYKLHKEFVRTYEPSTLRIFLLGRTETVNPVSAMSKAWVMSMYDKKSSMETRRDLLKKAVTYQTKYRLDATIGKGCDRHLLALMCASRELGMDLPNIFMDKPWQMPYKLSTSQTPTRVFEYGADYDYPHTNGGFGPACHDGYGISYVIFGDDFLNFNITTYKSCESTSSEKFSNSIHEAMQEISAIFA